MNADPLTYAPFLLLLLLGALVEIRYWIRNRARMTPKARLRRGLFLAAVPVLCAALWLGWSGRLFGWRSIPRLRMPRSKSRYPT